MAKITYKVGDATNPCISDGVQVIPHICNNCKGWGAGFVLALSKKWKAPEVQFRRWSNPQNNQSLVGDEKYELGNVAFVSLDGFPTPKTYVANMVAQHGIYPVDGIQPIRYDALEKCLNKVAKKFGQLVKDGTMVTIHMPRIGAGLAGGEWPKIEELINKTLVNANYDVYVYDLKSEVDAGKWGGTKYN